MFIAGIICWLSVSYGFWHQTTGVCFWRQKQTLCQKMINVSSA